LTVFFLTLPRADSSLTPPPNLGVLSDLAPPDIVATGSVRFLPSPSTKKPPRGFFIFTPKKFIQGRQS
jgi:hypothetical protein